MVSKNVSLAAIAVVIVISCVAIVGINMATDNGQTYSISYELNGGINSDSNPTEYISGHSYDLYDATSDEYLFAGWYLDEDLTVACESITSDMSGDLVLYAGWNNNLEGMGFVLSISGTMDGGWFSKYTMSGETTYKYLYYDATNDRYYMSYSSSVVYKSGLLSQTNTHEESYWSDESSDTIWTYGGTKSIDTVDGVKECQVFIGTDSVGSYTETQYIGDGWIPYSIIYDSSDYINTTHLVYTFVKTITFEVDESYDVVAYSDYGVSVSGDGTYNIGDTVSLTASVSNGTNFVGWCDSNGNVLSTSKTYSFEISGSDVTVYALNDDDSDYTYESDVAVTLLSDTTFTSAEWSIYSQDSGSVIATLSGISPTYTFDYAGMYYIYIDGSDGDKSYNIRYDVFVSGDVSRTFTWKSDGSSYTYTIEIDYDDLLYYRNYYSVNQRQQDYPTHTRDVTFVTYADKYIVAIAKDFASMTAGMTDLEVSNFVLAFTQYIEYQADDVYMGYSEYWKFPLETLFDQGGDCEDTSILYCAIMKAMDYDVALLLFTGHMAGAVSIDGCTSAGYTTNGKTYYYCETTATGYDTGDIPASMRNSSARVVIV